LRVEGLAFSVEGSGLRDRAEGLVVLPVEIDGDDVSTEGGEKEEGAHGRGGAQNDKVLFEV
jgi:hypothetical protein